MKKWEQFELDCVAYLNQKYGMYAGFTHKGGADSTVPDILVETRSGSFYIEAKHSPAQCGQFVLLPDADTQTFYYSEKNEDEMNPQAEAIKEYMDQNFAVYSDKSRKRKKIAMPGDQEIFAAWIAQHYWNKGVRFFITNGFKIISIGRFRECFAISANYRVKRSGSNPLPKRDIPAVQEFLATQPYEIESFQTEGKKLFAVSDQPYHDSRFFWNGNEYRFAQQDGRYEIKKLSNTYNSNVIFSVKLNTDAPGLTDQEFITALI